MYLSFFNVVGVPRGRFVGFQNYANLLGRRLLPAARSSTTITFTFCVDLQVHARTGGRAAAPQPAALGRRPGRPRPAAVHHPRSRARAGLADPARPAVRRAQLHPGQRPARADEGPVLARRSEHGAALGHHGQRLGRHAVLRHPVPGRPQGRSTASCTTRRRSTAPTRGGASCTSRCPACAT